MTTFCNETKTSSVSFFCVVIIIGMICEMFLKCNLSKILKIYKQTSVMGHSNVVRANLSVAVIGPIGQRKNIKSAYPEGVLSHLPNIIIVAMTVILK